MDEQAALANLRDAAAVLAGVTHWLDCGTLLGAIREGGLLAHDQDVDFGVLGTDDHEAIEAGMVAAGFKVWRLYGTPEHGYEQSFKRDGIKVDVFYFYPHEEGLWQGSWLRDHLIVSTFARSTVVDPVAFRFRGIDTFVPARPKAMLERRYGDWRTPVTKWDWARDPKCITPETRV